ncbi:L,D-transpeptidase family protein [Psychrobacter glacincola]|uniref:L,D-transpeptidase family protein n=1 Tax=Psychrobacter glacincola TaxID=56810 RepID=UPI0039B08B30
MSFFYLTTYKNTRGLLAAFVLAAVAIMSSSASAMASTNNSLDNTGAIPKNTVIDKVFVDKSARILQLLSDNKVIKTYHVALGGNPIGHKQKQGDQRTPSGAYILDYKNEKSKYYRSIHVSYPNAADKARAKKLGVNPGGDIMIHGQKNGFGQLASITQRLDWTEGCIAVTNDEMDEIMAAVKVGTAIEIVE